MERFTLEPTGTGVNLYDHRGSANRSKLLCWLNAQDGAIMRDLLNREFPQETGKVESDEALGYCAVCTAPILRTDIGELPIKTEPPATRPLRRERRKRIAMAVLVGLEEAIARADALIAALDEPK